MNTSVFVNLTLFVLLQCTSVSVPLPLPLPLHVPVPVPVPPLAWAACTWAPQLGGFFNTAWLSGGMLRAGELSQHLGMGYKTALFT